VIGKETRSEFGPRELVYCSDGSCVRSTVWLDAMVQYELGLYKKCLVEG
jgi:hypothetical protein